MISAAHEGQTKEIWRPEISDETYSTVADANYAN